LRSRPAESFSSFQPDDLFVQHNEVFCYDHILMVMSKKTFSEPASLPHFVEKVCQGIPFVQSAIDVLMTRIYEDMVLESLSRERYQKMSDGYETEQAALNNEIIGLEDWVGTREDANNSVDAFLALVKKYVDIPELTPTIVNEFIKKIIVYAPEKQDTKRIQKVRIIFNFLDELDMPEIGEPVVTETTYGRRKTA